MAQPWPDNAPDLAALVQQFLVFHGGRYTSLATEDNWKVVPVTLQVPDNRPIPGGTWLVVPWDMPTLPHLQLWLQRLTSLGSKPGIAVLVVDAPMLDPVDVRQLALAAGLELIVCSAQPPAVFGSRAAVALEHLLEPSIRDEITQANPLHHLYALGDPRDPAVFSERLRRAAPLVPVTRAIIVINAAIFVAMVLGSPHYAQTSALGVLLQGFELRQLADWGGNAAGLTTGAGAWRLLASAFLHGSLVHIGMNLWVLRQVGDTAERLFGSANYLAVYLLSGLGGSVASLGWHALHAPGAISVGASGAIFGVMGGTLGFALARRDVVPRAVYSSLIRSGVFFAAVNISLGMAMSIVDNAAHLGGLLTGLATGAVLSRELPPAPQASALQRGALIAAALAVLGLMFRVVSGWAA